MQTVQNSLKYVYLSSYGNNKRNNNKIPYSVLMFTM
jgi:hypothetical protein